ncbi:hypothetical protein D2V93_02435 [Flagellimonas taeanensis]|uniref:O-antigen ligase family protein n=1 Tax=Flavobacteriaceae TaxID=49546 RepID=UPI000E68B2F5|nr:MULTISPECIES: O-antigen ligase family protein [Allomuricauda]MDC6385468.1 O-antigen ligase family protein [Muricauda sp. SK9]RIV53024.1 hypothetical protein D2V93_02435 [Allomuricauda taeanensis]
MLLRRINAERLGTWNVLLISALLPSPYYHFALFLFICHFLLWLKNKYYLHFNKQTLFLSLPILVYFLLFVISLLYTDDRLNGLKEIEQHLTFLLVPVLLTHRVSLDMAIKIRKTFLFSTIAFVLLANMLGLYDIVLNNANTVFFEKSPYHRMISYGLTSPFKNWHPTYVVISLVISTIFILGKKLVFPIMLSSFLLIFIGINIVLLNSIMGVFIFLSLILYFSLLDRNYKILLFLTIPILIVLFSKNSKEKLDKVLSMEVQVTDRDHKNSLNLRLAKWKTCLDVFKENVFFGTSPGDNRKDIMNKFIHNKFLFCAENKFGPHNQYLYVLTAFGLLGITPFFAALFFPLYWKYETDFMLFTAIFALFFISEDVLEREQGIFLWTFFYTFHLNTNRAKIKN